MCVHVCITFFFRHVILLALFSHLIIVDILHVKAHRELFFVNYLVVCYMNAYLIGELPVFPFPSPSPLPCSLPPFLPPFFNFFCLYSPPVHVVLSVCTVLTGMCKENSFPLAVLSGTYSLPFPHPDCFNSYA